jgi:predicted  nucleic acid-binding Zn-ribbon protein
MSMTVRSILMTTILVSATVVGGSREGHAKAGTQPSPDILAALLVEVKGLREAMEQMASAGPRIQLALGRLQLQEQRVNTLVRRLEEVKVSLVQARGGLGSLSDQVVGLERGIRETTDAEKRRDFEAELGEVRRRAARAAEEVQRLQNDEAAMAQDISSEQARWSELNQRLEELERSLGRR